MALKTLASVRAKGELGLRWGGPLALKRLASVGAKGELGLGCGGPLALKRGCPEGEWIWIGNRQRRWA